MRYQRYWLNTGSTVHCFHSAFLHYLFSLLYLVARVHSLMVLLLVILSLAHASLQILLNGQQIPAQQNKYRASVKLSTYFHTSLLSMLALLHDPEALHYYLTYLNHLLRVVRRHLRLLHILLLFFLMPELIF